MKSKEEEFIDKMQWCNAEMVELVKGQGVDGIEYNTVYKDLQGRFFKTEFKMVLMEGDVDVNAEQEKYVKDAAIFQLIHPERKVTIINPKNDE